MSTSQQTARTVESGGAVDLDSYLWPDKGVEPTETGDAAYAPYKEPIAGIDNDANHGVTWDIGALNYETGQMQERLDSLEAQIDDLRNDLDTLENSFGSHDHDGRYYRKSEADDRFVNETGDTISGQLTINRGQSNGNWLTLNASISELNQTVMDGHGRSSWYWNVESGTQELITDNEGASWFRMRGGDLMMSVYEGEPGDAGTVPDWERVLEAKYNFLDMPSGARVGDTLEMNDNSIDEIRRAGFQNVGNDFITVNDASGGTNDNPHTLRFNDRHLRLFSGDTGDIMTFMQGGDVEMFNGNFNIEKQAAEIGLGGFHGGPHSLVFGNTNDNNGIQLTYHTTPNAMDIQTWRGDTIARFDMETQSADFGSTPYVVLPVRGGAPADPPAGATWIET